MNNFDQDLLNSLSNDAKEKLNKQQDIYSDLYDSDDSADVVYEGQDEIENYMKPQNKLDVNGVNTSSRSIDESDYIDTSYGNLETIYPNGPTLSDIEIWKRKYPTCLVFAVEIAGINFVCRTITRPEYKKLVSLYDLDQLQREEVICSTCILDPKDIEWEDIINLYGGIPSTLATIIMEYSGFTTQYGVYVL